MKRKSERTFKIMQEVIMAKYGEIALKGLNKNTFEDILVKNIKEVEK